MSTQGIFVKFAGKGVEGAAVVAAVEGAFGAKASAMIEKKKGFAKVIFESEASVKKAVAAGSVNVGGVSLPLEQLKPKETASNGKAAAATKGTQDAGKEDPCSIYVSGLPNDFQAAELKEAMGAFGEVKSLDTMRKRKNGSSVFIAYATEAAANAAVAKSPIPFKGASLQVEKRKSRAAAPKKEGGEAGRKEPRTAAPRAPKAVENKVVYVANIAYSVGEEELKGAMSGAQSVTSKVRECFCALEFATEAALAQAVEACKAGTPFQGATLKCEAWRSKRPDDKLGKTLHVSGFAGLNPSEAEIKQAFAKLGSFTVSIKPTRKYALITFVDGAAAAQAVADVKAGKVKVAVQPGETLAAELSDSNLVARRRNRGPRNGGAK